MWTEDLAGLTLSGDLEKQNYYRQFSIVNYIHLQHLRLQDSWLDINILVKHLNDSLSSGVYLFVCLFVWGFLLFGWLAVDFIFSLNLKVWYCTIRISFHFNRYELKRLYHFINHRCSLITDNDCCKILHPKVYWHTAWFLTLILEYLILLT